MSSSLQPSEIPQWYIECGLIFAYIWAAYTILRLLRYFMRSRTSLPLAYLQPTFAMENPSLLVLKSSVSFTVNHQSGAIPLRLRPQRRRHFLQPPTSRDLKRLDAVLDAAYRAEIDDKQRTQMAQDGLDDVLFQLQHLSLTSFAKHQMEVAQLDIEEPMIID